MAMPSRDTATPTNARRIQGLLNALVTVGAFLLGAVGTAEPQPRPEMTVFAAVDLAFALKEIAAQFEKAHDAKVTLVLGSTGHLSQQVAHGAPADILFAANESFVDD